MKLTKTQKTYRKKALSALRKELKSYRSHFNQTDYWALDPSWTIDEVFSSLVGESPTEFIANNITELTSCFKIPLGVFLIEGQGFRILPKNHKFVFFNHKHNKIVLRTVKHTSISKFIFPCRSYNSNESFVGVL